MSSEFTNNGFISSNSKNVATINCERLVSKIVNTELITTPDSFFYSNEASNNISHPSLSGIPNPITFSNYTITATIIKQGVVRFATSSPTAISVGGAPEIIKSMNGRVGDRAKIIFYNIQLAPPLHTVSVNNGLTIVGSATFTRAAHFIFIVTNTDVGSESVIMSRV